MSHRATRRQFLHTTAAGGLALGLGDLAFLGKVPPASAAEAKLDPKVVRLQADIEPLVRFLEQTPQAKLIEEAATKVRRGTTYQEMLAALLLAGVRNIEPRPNVGFKFHAVLVVNSAHLASLGSPDSDRWLPIFWALDEFKKSQAANIKERGGWRMGPVNEGKVPPPHQARQAFNLAMESWDVPAADAATAGLARTAGAHEVFELFCRFSPRDFRDIGHKAIFLANSYRTLQCIGWQHAEPILRSLAYATLQHNGDNPSKRDDPADRPGRRNWGLANAINSNWRDGKEDAGAVAEMLDTLRHASEDDSCKRVVDLLNRGIAAQSIWDALLCNAGEQLMRKPNIVALHAVTTTNALRYLYEATGSDQTRRWLLLQNAAFLPLFREANRTRDPKTAPSDIRIDQFEAEPLRESGPKAVAEIFADVGKDNVTASRKALGYLKDGQSPKELIDAARVLIFLKGNNSHDYKFSSAALEDYHHVSPAWRDRFLASSVFNLRGSAMRDNSLVARIRSAFQA